MPVAARAAVSAAVAGGNRRGWLPGSELLLLSRALAGLALVAAGYRWGDPVAGFAITAFICHVGNEVTTDMLARLMDGLDPGDLDAESAAAAVHRIRPATVRGRWMGRTLQDVETRPSGSLPPAHADQISRQVADAVARARPRGRPCARGRARLNPGGPRQERFASSCLIELLTGTHRSSLHPRQVRRGAVEADQPHERDRPAADRALGQPGMPCALSIRALSTLS
jgi:hypothetical protein